MQIDGHNEDNRHLHVCERLKVDLPWFSTTF